MATESQQNSENETPFKALNSACLSRPHTLEGLPKKTVLISLQPMSPHIADRSDTASAGHKNQPIKARVVFNVTLAIFVTSIVSLGVSIICLAFALWGSEYLLSGAVITCLCLTVAGIVRWAGHPLSHTALLQGYLLVGVLCTLSCVVQLVMALLLLLLHTNHTFEIWVWVQFLGGGQLAGLVVVVVVVAAGGAVVVMCGGKRLPHYRDNSVHVYTPR